MDKIVIPNGADCYALDQDGKLTYYVNFSSNITAFNLFVDSNKIRGREGIVVLDNHIFTNDKSVFSNFPKQFDCLGSSVKS